MTRARKSSPFAARSVCGLPAMTVVAMTVVAMTPLGCETRVVRYDPMLGGLPGVESNTRVVRDLGDYRDPTKVTANKIEVENPDGTKTLTARTGRHLMVHIYNTLVRDEKALFNEQVLSEVTRKEFAERGKKPDEAFETLLARFDDIQELFNRMPLGEYTPGVFIKSVGQRTKRVALDDVTARDLVYSGFDMVMEDGNYRLRWFIPGGATPDSSPRPNPASNRLEEGEAAPANDAKPGIR